MTFGEQNEWARAFLEQARLDIELADALHKIIMNPLDGQLLGTRPDLYLPSIYAYCQQAIEKSLKALLWHSSGSIPKRHNPLGSITRSPAMKAHNRPTHIEIIDRNRSEINKILDMAPGASLDNPRMDDLLRQPNTEYPFKSSDKGIRLPCQTIHQHDVTAALKISKPLVSSAQKHMETVGLLPWLYEG